MRQKRCLVPSAPFSSAVPSPCYRRTNSTVRCDKTPKCAQMVPFEVKGGSCEWLEAYFSGPKSVRGSNGNVLCLRGPCQDRVVLIRCETMQIRPNSAVKTTIHNRPAKIEARSIPPFYPSESAPTTLSLRAGQAAAPRKTATTPKPQVFQTPTQAIIS